jgi:hypothetical protein
MLICKKTLETHLKVDEYALLTEEKPCRSKTSKLFYITFKGNFKAHQNSHNRVKNINAPQKTAHIVPIEGIP